MKSLTFRYPEAMRVLFCVIGFVPLLLLAGITIGRIQLGSDGPTRLWAFLICSIIPFLVIHVVFTELRIEEDKISIRRLFWTKSVPWSEIIAVKHAPSIRRLNLTTPFGIISVHKQFRGYPEIYRILRERIAPAAFEPFPSGYFVVSSSPFRRLRFAMPLVLAWLGWGASLNSHYTSWAQWFYVAAIVVLFSAVFTVFLQIEFNQKEIRLVYPMRTVTYAVDDMREIKLVQGFKDIALQLSFVNRKLKLGESELDMAPERLAEGLRMAYGKQIHFPVNAD